MFKKAIFLLIVLLLSATPLLAQDDAPEEPRYDCPAFTSASTVERTSYYMGEGAAYLRSQNYGAAINAYGCIIQQIDGNYRDAYLNRAAAYGARREYDKALADYGSATRIDGNYAPTYNNRGVIYMAMEDYESALRDFNRALELDGNYAAGFINRGILYAVQGEYGSAEAEFQHAVDAAGLQAAIADLSNPDRPQDAPPPVYDFNAARAYALIGTVRSQSALDAYNDYLLLTGNRADSRIQSAAGALQSRFNFELRFDDGSWLLVTSFVDQ